MRVLVVSDTHGYAERIKLVLDQEGEFDVLIHCGDIEGQENYIRNLADWRCFMVRGNNDGASFLEREITTNLGDDRIMIVHGHQYGVSLGIERLREEAKSRGVKLCFFGHTHKPYNETFGNLTMINPGSLTYPRQIGRKHTYLVMEIDRDHDVHFRYGELAR